MESSGIGQFIPLILIFVIFIFLDKTSTKKVKEHKAMVEAKKGDKIVTSGGITGTITRVVDNDKIEVEIADNAVEVIRGTGVQSLMNSQSKKINIIEIKCYTLKIKNNFCFFNIFILYFYINF